MSKQEALYQSLASCGAALIIFIGICHGFVGEALFPWGPAFFLGPVGWYGAGIAVIILGFLLLGGILRRFSFPVVAVSLVTAVGGLAIAIIAQVLHNQFHLFALAVTFSGLLIAYFYRKAFQESIS